jgi:hypothetical protein
MTGIDVRGRLLFPLRRHDRGIRLAGNTARPELLALDIFFGEGRFDTVRLGPIGILAMCGGILSAHVTLSLMVSSFESGCRETVNGRHRLLTDGQQSARRFVAKKPAWLFAVRTIARANRRYLRAELAGWRLTGGLQVDDGTSDRGSCWLNAGALVSEVLALACRYRGDAGKAENTSYGSSTGLFGMASHAIADGIVLFSEAVGRACAAFHRTAAIPS